MKNLFKKVVSTVVTVALAATSMFTMASCGKNSEFAEDTFKIGATGPLTGDAASYGTSVKNGASLAVKHLNEKGGKYSFVMKDDAASPEDAGTNYDVLYESGMQFSLGGTTSGAAYAFAKKAKVDNLFCMTPSASADNVITDMDNSYRLCFGDPDQGILAAQMIVKDYKNIGALYDTSDPYSSGVYAAFKEEMAKLNATYEETTFDSENKVDFTTQAEKLKDCDVVFMPFYYQEASLFMKAAVKKEFKGTFFGCDGFDGIKDLIADVKNDIKYITPFDVDSKEENVKAFVEAYKAEYGSEPDQFAADAYDVVMAFDAALKAAGVTDTNISVDEVSEKLKETFTKDTFSFTGLTGTMKWEKSGACHKDPVIVEFNK